MNTQSPQWSYMVDFLSGKTEPLKDEATTSWTHGATDTHCLYVETMFLADAVIHRNKA